MKIFLTLLLVAGSTSCSNNFSLSQDAPKHIPTTLTELSNTDEEILSEDYKEEEQGEVTTMGETTEIEEETESEIIEENIYGELSLPALTEEEIIGSDLVLEEVLATTTNYTRYRISYKNGGLNLSGIMNIPAGDGPFPLLILNHGYIDTRYYTNGRGLKREQDYFANNGFVVLHPDYRNHAFSDTVSETPYDFRLGYTTDVIASVLAVQNSELPELSSIDSSRVGMLGHSMGGGVTQNVSVTYPDLIDAVVLYGPVSNQEYLNFEQFQLSNAERSARVNQVTLDHKTSAENPVFWDGVSSRTFRNNITAPYMIFTGTADDSTPTEWAQDIASDLQEAQKQLEIVSYLGEGHEFGPQFNDFMQQSGEFFKRELGE